MKKKRIRDYDLSFLNIGSMEDEKANYRQIIEEKSVQVPHEDYDVETEVNPEQEVAFTIIMEKIIQEEVIFSLMD